MKLATSNGNKPASRAQAWPQTDPRGRLMSLAIVLLLLLCTASLRLAVAAEPSGAGPQASVLSEDSRKWRFRVYLDDKEIGYHDFVVASEGETHVVSSIAAFEYKLLFVKLYEYQHQNNESWQGDCLQSIESSTDANGKPFAVKGQAQSGRFVIQGEEGETSLPRCVMTFAYWNPKFLEQKQLLNSQNGEYLQVETSPPVLDELEVRGETREAWRYRLAAGDLNLALWYSTDQQWLGLESTTEGGRILRYELL